MARIVIIGAGVVGLGTGLLLAKDGHTVTALERDPEPAPTDPERAWEDWNRRGVNQFRLPHFFLARFRQIVDTELPELAAALEKAGALRLNMISDVIPESMTGGWRDGDEAYAVLTARRPVMEAALAAIVRDQPNLDLRRGTAVAGLSTGPATSAGVPHVDGVVTEAGETIPADLVVDMSGRRSALPRWLEAIGAGPAHEELDDSGFIYFGRHFRSADGSIPPMLGGGLQHYGTVSTLSLPADNGTWAVALIVSAKDKALLGLRDPDRWAATFRRFPLVAHWLDGTPLEDNITVMAKIEDRYRSLAPQGRPVVTGLVNVADAWACSNPSVGRGASIGMLHGQLLRDQLRSVGLNDPLTFANEFHRATAVQVEPWYRDTLQGDRDRLAEIEAAGRGEVYNPGRADWELSHQIAAAQGSDGDCIRAALAVAFVLERQADLEGRPDLLDKIRTNGADWRNRPVLGPDRAELVSLAGA
ncbi:MAG TPA: FAD-dependent oxidoreductase [Acidimicrobiales bacterium]|nr:FAD-dependent oxidoreductase [Acidimicrobiales bacterium]